MTASEGPAPATGTGPENFAAAKPLSLTGQGSARRPESAATQMRRRREAARRCEQLHDGVRDPWPRRTEDASPSVAELDSWARTLAYLRSVGLAGLPPANVRRALAARPERYASVLPRKPAA